MRATRLTTPLVRTAVALAVAAAGAAPLAAQSQRALFAWNGRVDREVLLVMRRGGVETRFSGGSYDEDRGRVRVGSALPRAAGYVNVRLVRGRGAADVVQQPSANNDYTAVVRLRDDQSGTGDYQVTALWQPADGGYADGGYGRGDDGDWGRDDRGTRGGNGRGWGWGRDRDRDNNGRDDRDERRDRRRRDRERDRDGGYDRDDRTSGTNGGWGGILGRRTGGTSDAAGVLRWSGRVDDVQEIRIRGRRASTQTVSGQGASDVRTSVSGAALSGDARVQVRTFDGRGSVRVVQQPSARNGYTAVLRVEDRDGGSDFYDFEASWY